MKKILVFVFIVVIAAGATFYYFSENQTNFSKDSSAYKAIPVSAPLFLEISSAKELAVRNGVMEGLADVGLGRNWIEFVNKADSLISSTDKLSKRLLDTPFVLTWGISGRSDLVPLVIMKADSENGQENLNELIHVLFPSQKNFYTKREYGKFSITEVNRGRNKDAIFFSFTDDLFLISSKSIIIEQVILQLTTQGILKNQYFNEVLHAAGSEGIQLFINHNRFDGFLNNILNRKITEKRDEFGMTLRFQPVESAKKFIDFAGWSEYDFKFDNDHLLLSGTTSADDSLNHFLSVFDVQQPVRFSAADALPVNTSFFCTYAFSDKNAFFERLENFFLHTTNYYHREERMKRFDRGIRGNIRKSFMDIVKNEVTVSAGTIPVDPSGKTVYFLVPVTSQSTAEENLNKLISMHASTSGKSVSDYLSEFSVDSEVQYNIYQFPFPSFPGLWLGSPFTMAEAGYVTIHNNNMVFANTESGLHDYLRQMMTGSTLGKDIKYQKYRQQTQNRANINVYVDINKIFSYRNHLLAESILFSINEAEEHVRKFDRINWQFQRGKTNYLSNMSISYQAEQSEDAKTTWQSVVGSNISIKPQLMVNHTIPNEKDILIQDTQNNLHQVTSAGRVRWSVPLTGEILSEIHQIDYYRNGRLQYLFNTKDKVYLLDRNGNNVADFPITLPAQATNGVTVFDYDKNRNYRYFVAGADYKIYAFNHEGKSLQGWEFDKTESEVSTPIQHFKVGSKDYIVFKDKTGIYIQNRQGQERISVSSYFKNSRNPVYLNLDGQPKFVFTDKNGKVFYIFLNGNIEEKKTASFSEKHFFIVDDLDGNSIPDFIFVDGNELTVMNEQGKRLFNRKFNRSLLNQPAIYTFSNQLKKIGVTDAMNNQIYLINPDGKLQEGFPLQGNSEFTIGKLTGNTSGLNLIVGGEGGMLFNYTLSE